MLSLPSFVRIGNWTHMSGVAPSMEGHFQDAIMTELPRHVIISPLISGRLSTPENVSTVIRRNIDRLNWPPQLESRLRLNHRRRNFRGRSHWSKTWGRKRGVGLDGQRTITIHQACEFYSQSWITDAFFAPGSETEAHGWSREEGVRDLELPSPKVVSVTTSKATFFAQTVRIKLACRKISTVAPRWGTRIKDALLIG